MVAQFHLPCTLIWSESTPNEATCHLRYIDFQMKAKFNKRMKKVI